LFIFHQSIILISIGELIPQPAEDGKRCIGEPFQLKSCGKSFIGKHFELSQVEKGSSGNPFDLMDMEKAPSGNIFVLFPLFFARKSRNTPAKHPVKE